jgi:Na+/proline symporter
MQPLDWIIVAAYFALSAAVGLAYTRRAGRSMSEFFLSGRALPWWLAGTSMVATTFAVDTPLAVAGLTANSGVAGNWVWWSFVMSGILTVFFYAHLWRRAGVVTDAEFTEIRYSGRPAAILRAFRALYMALPINLIIMGWVNLAMVKVLAVTVGVAPVSGFILMFVITLSYSALAGMWGAVVTDLVQFVIAMIGSIALAYYAVAAVGGLDALITRLPERFASADAALTFVPASGTAMIAVLAFIAVQWWATSYPGSEPGGGGYVAQRIFSARSERDGMLATLWFNIAHYAVRPWPWIATAFAAMLLYPGETDPANAYLRTVVDLLPTGVKGLLIAAFAAAYMSTIGTQLNWGASYLVNDLYVRFIDRSASERHLVRVSRLATAVIFLLSGLVTYWLHRAGSIEGAWRIIIALGAGTGLVSILRWYWWRINAWTEISAMAAAIITFVLLTATRVFDPTDLMGGVYLMLTTTLVTTAIWLAVTFLTAPASEATLDAFYRRVRPGGPGWRRVAGRTGFGAEPIADGPLSWVNWVAGVVSVYASLFGVGRLLFGPRSTAVVYLAVAAAAFALIARNLARTGARAEPALEKIAVPAAH